MFPNNGPIDAQRESLRFPQAVTAAFLFLNELGFDQRTTEASFVRFVSGDRFINVFHGRTSYEIGVEVGFFSDGANAAFSLYLLQRLTNRQQADAYRRPVARTAEGVKEAVEAVAKTFRSVAGPFLNGSAEFARHIREEKKVVASELSLHSRVVQVRPRAEEAFRKRRYADAAALYQSIREGLTTAEEKKLEYALRQISAGASTEREKGMSSF